MNETPHFGLMPDGNAKKITRGVIRFFVEQGNACLTEFSFKTGRRADIISLNRKGAIAVVEVKTSATDFRSDEKWHEYLEFCDLFYFAVAIDFYRDILPNDCGLIVGDAYGASIVRKATPRTLNAARRKAVTLRFARASAKRLIRFTDPDWIRG